MFRDLQKARFPAFTAIAGHRDFSANVSYERQAFARRGYFVSGTYFPVLQLRPALGRLLSPVDDDPASPPVVVLAHWFWDTNLGGDPSLVGKTLMLNGKATTIVGVAPDFFNGMTYGSRPAFTLAWGGTHGTGIERRDGALSILIYASRGAAPKRCPTSAQGTPSITIIREVEAPLAQHARFGGRSAFSPGGGDHAGKPWAKGHGRRCGPALFMFSDQGLSSSLVREHREPAVGEGDEPPRLVSHWRTRGRLIVQLLTETIAAAFLGGLT